MISNVVSPLGKKIILNFMSNKFRVQEVKRIAEPTTPFATLIYNHFQYLSNDHFISHNVDEIKRLLIAPQFIGLLVYDADDKIVAYLVGEIQKLDDGRQVYYIYYFYVIERHRGKQIGSKLIDMLVKKCKEQHIKHITLTCDTDDKKLVQFYFKRGFRVDNILRTGRTQEVYTYDVPIGH
jgi:ribosomal protein S18 acetylase RimI-like enzyme